MTESFFICTKCSDPGFEKPVFGIDGIYHNSCYLNLSDLDPKKEEFFKKVPTSQGRVFIKEKFLFIEHTYSASMLSEYQKVPSIRWDPVGKKRKISLPKIDRRVKDFILNLTKTSNTITWDIEKEVLEHLESIKDSLENETVFCEIDRIKKDNNPNIDFSFLKKDLFGYQKAGVSFLEFTNGVALIGDEMGLGKTSTAIAYCSKNNLKTIVVTTASLKYNWKSEVENFCKKNAFILGSFPNNVGIESSDFVITNYDQLKKWEKVLVKLKFDCVILDESHYISNLSSARTKYVFKLFKKIKKRILLSGTPVKNRPIELYPQLKFLYPKEFSNKSDFGFRYCGPKKGFNGYWEFKGSSNLDELNDRMKRFYIRRKKKDVLSDLPEKRVSNIVFDLSSDETKEYKALFVKSGPSLGRKFNTKEKKSSLIELMKFCSISKVDRVEEFVKNMISEDTASEKKVIIFAHFRDTQEELKKRFKDISVSISGGDSAESRQKSVDEFQKNNDIRVFIGSTLASGTGLNLTAADTVIFCDLVWVPAELKQAEARAHRIGQTSNVFVYYLTFTNTIEDIVWGTLKSKLSVVSESLGDQEEDTMIDNLFSKLYDNKSTDTI